MKIGFIGLGNVGAKLAGTLIRNGIVTFIHDLEHSKAKKLITMGGIWKESPADITANSEIIITCLPSPKASASVIEGKNGILQTATKKNMGRNEYNRVFRGGKTSSKIFNKGCVFG